MRLGWLIAVACAAACARGSAPIPHGSTDDTLALPRFPHAQHSEVRCTECHAPNPLGAGALARPGAREHAPCDRDQCHREAFLLPPSLLCTGCHDEVDPTGIGPTTLAPYPPEYGPRTMAARFSHELHLDYLRMERAVGFHISCTDCHGPAGQRRSLPDHTTCARCHAQEVALEQAPNMAACIDCHRERARRPPRMREYIIADVTFSHDRHEADRRGKPIACGTCHDKVAQITATGTHPAPETATCVACHDDDERTPNNARMRNCETCHLTRSNSFGTLAPRSHLPASETPVDHTLAFRNDHAIEARNRSRDCARCHTQMSGSTRDTCDECHQAMEPRDHTVGWREYDHGPAAGADRDRCATCHTAGFCVSCHSRPPRSHLPLAEFARGGHGPLADLNLRACLVCHGDVQRDCTGQGCHIQRSPGASR